MTRNVLLWVQYEGTDFSGWQYQLEDRTVQGVLGEAVRKMVRHEVTLYGSSRTDAGVHARALPVNFETLRDTITLHGFMRGLNSHLPNDVAVIGVEERPLGWRARRAAVAKTYHYRYQLGRARQPLLWRSSWNVRAETLDVDAMRAAAARLVGTHDFAAFRAAGCDSKSTLRLMHSVEVDPEGPDLLLLRITGNAFLRNMVRVIAGSLAEVGRGRRDADSLSAALASRVRAHAGPTAPARGLTLQQVHFDGYPRVGKDFEPVP